MFNIMGIVLAAGLGKRMKSSRYKVLHPVCGKSMVEHVLGVLDQAGVNRKVVVVGHGADLVKQVLGERAEYALQQQQCGTGHAVRMAEPLLGAETGITLVVYGDTPLITSMSLTRLIQLHQDTQAAVTLLTARFDNPTGLGRIVRSAKGTIERIVEQKDCNSDELGIQEVNAGIYCFDNRLLFEALQQVTNQNAQGEYYLTDVIGILRAQGKEVQGYCTDDPDEAFGVNDRVALAEAERIMRARINQRHMVNGVTIIDPAHTYIEADVTVGADTILWPGTILRGDTHIGSDCEIGPNADILNTNVANRSMIKQSVLSGAEIGESTVVGPFAHLRPGARLGDEVKVGDFVEIKNSILGHGSKVSHLAYVGDAQIGNDVNVGCGAITVNYDGFSKQETVIEDGAFIGSNVNLIAPIRVGKGAYVVAGSTITKDVPADDLAIARERQTNKPGYARMLKARLKVSKETKA